jgi:phage shock protein E
MKKSFAWLTICLVAGASFCVTCGERAGEATRQPVPEEVEVPGVQSDSSLIIIDVRTRGEFDEGHLEPALHIPYEQIGERIGEVTTDLDQQIMVYCRVGHRSGIAQETLRQMGYRNVVNGGGYEDLKGRYGSTKRVRTVDE